VQSAVSRDAATVGAPGGAEPPMATPFPAGPTRLPTTGPTLPPLSTLTAQLSQEEPPRTSVLPPAASLAIFQVIDNALEGGPQAFARAIGAHPAILTHRSYVESCIDRLPNLVMRSQLRQTFSAALIRAQFEQARQRREALRNQDAIASGSSAAAATQDPSQQWTAEPAPAAGTSNPRAGTSAQPASQLTAAQLAAAAAHQAHAHVPHEANLHQVPSPVPGPVPSTPLPTLAQEHHPHISLAPIGVHDAANPARVFKLQYDARRIICCSQRSVIVGWDFCNGDAELEEASRFFAPVD
jgi:F-box and WD-40 domain protein 1/11